jgi:hypothetical protein
MSQIFCPAGHQFSDTLFPCKYKYYLVGDWQVDDIAEKAAGMISGPDPMVAIGYAISAAGPLLYICPECQRLVVFWKEGKLPPVAYEEMVLKRSGQN